MSMSRSTAFKAASAATSVALMAGALLATPARADIGNPQSIAPGTTTPVSVPVYGSGDSNYQSKVTGTGLQYCFNTTCGTGSLTLLQIATDFDTGDGGLLEVAGTTNLNPGGSSVLTFAFALGGVDASDVASVTVPGLSTWDTDVQACTPNLALPCPSTDSGAAATRDTAGNITFWATDTTTGLPVNSVDGIAVTDVYGIFTNAPLDKLGADPMVVVTYTNGTTLDFSGLTLLAPSSTGTVPEPSMLALLAAGLAILGLGMGMRRRAQS